MRSSELECALLALDEMQEQRDEAKRQLKVMTHEHRLACVDRDAMQRERDEARRWICEQKASCSDRDAKWWAGVHTWDCFKEDGK